MPRKQQKNMKGGAGFWEALGFKSKEDITPDERTKRIKELETQPAKDLAEKVVDLETEVKGLKSTIEELKNPKVPDTGIVAPGPVAAGPPAPAPVAGGSKKRKTRRQK